jgi:hypothetical protein
MLVFHNFIQIPQIDNNSLRIVFLFPSENVGNNIMPFLYTFFYYVLARNFEISTVMISLSLLLKFQGLLLCILLKLVSGKTSIWQCATESRIIGSAVTLHHL